MGSIFLHRQVHEQVQRNTVQENYVVSGRFLVYCFQLQEIDLDPLF